MTYPTLPMIAALVRAGAVDRAAELFAAAGHDRASGNPAALALKGRIAKAQARLASADAQPARFAEAAAAYRAAHDLDPAPYLAINAATLSLLAGDPAAATSGARAVLALLDGPEPPADTPYFLAATRAEALLLLGDRAGAEAALTEAANHDPDGWDDRAVTLAQLREILGAQGEDCAWLDRFAPPASLHFAGHMGIHAGGSSEAVLTEALDHWLGSQRIGFAWGALAAGADVVIAERLQALGCAVHLVLPCPPEQFAAQSVAPAGREWAARFEAVMARAASLRCAGSLAGSVHDPLATAFAGELAIGGAVLNAARLGSAALQLIVLDETGGGPNTARQAELWQGPDGSRQILTVPRDAAVEALFPPEAPDLARHLLFHAAIAFPGDGASLNSAELGERAALVGMALATLPQGSVRAGPQGWDVATPDVSAGLSATLAVIDMCRAAGTEPPAAGVDLALGLLVPDLASGSLVAHGPGTALAQRLLAQAPPGLVLASDPLSVTLAARPAGALRTEPWLPDEPELGGAVHAVFAKGQ